MHREPSSQKRKVVRLKDNSYFFGFFQLSAAPIATPTAIHVASPVAAKTAAPIAVPTPIIASELLELFSDLSFYPLLIYKVISGLIAIHLAFSYQGLNG